MPTKPRKKAGHGSDSRKPCGCFVAGPAGALRCHPPPRFLDPGGARHGPTYFSSDPSMGLAGATTVGPPACVAAFGPTDRLGRADRRAASLFPAAGPRCQAQPLAGGPAPAQASGEALGGPGRAGPARAPLLEDVLRD